MMYHNISFCVSMLPYAQYEMLTDLKTNNNAIKIDWCITCVNVLELLEVRNSVLATGKVLATIATCKQSHKVNRKCRLNHQDVNKIQKTTLYAF